MKIYFFSVKENNLEQPTAHKAILKFFKNNGVTVYDNLEAGGRPAKGRPVAPESLAGLVLEGRQTATQSGYSIALSLAQEKPILYLLPKGKALPDQLRPIIEHDKFRKLFFLRYYTLKTLQGILEEFLRTIETGELRAEVPALKFTLRLTPRVDRYLSWKAKKLKLAKADFIRNILDEIIKNDPDYRQ